MSNQDISNRSEPATPPSDLEEELATAPPISSVAARTTMTIANRRLRHALAGLTPVPTAVVIEEIVGYPADTHQPTYHHSPRFECDDP